MPTYRAPVKDMLYLLNDVLSIGNYSNLPGYADATPDLVSAILEEGGKFCENELAPLNRVGDTEGCIRHEDGSVTTPTGFKEAYAKYIEGGWTGLSHSEEWGGQGMPHVLGFCMEEMRMSANMAFSMYPGLSEGAIASIELEGTDAQKQTYLPNMVGGQWTGTMNLTEPHCGTDLGLLRTKAEPKDDGTYAISGTKIFISAGEHDMAENIIHLVLARLPDAPEGVKGISLFIVPKFIVKEDGSLGDRNGVVCGSIEEKMGIHGNSTCVLNYDNATGFLLGEPHKGLRAMFIMMNAARLGVGVQGLAQSVVSYQNAVDYAKDRIQSKALKDAMNADAKSQPIIVHPDVRRMLMNAKSLNEAARALCLWGALQIDLARKSGDERERQEADDLIGLLTPVIKGFLTDKGYENATNAQQVFGGHGYIAEWGMEQFVRDARIAMIYEGTNGIQALDLVGRKLGMHGGRAVQTFFKKVTEEIADAKGTESLEAFIDPLEKGLGSLQRATMWLMQNGMSNPDNAGAASVPYMHMFGHVVLGYMWLQMAKVSAAALSAAESDSSIDTEFHETKIATGRYYMRRVMPEIRGLLTEVEAGCDDMMALDAANF